jgi:hypothetical protein
MDGALPAMLSPVRRIIAWAALGLIENVVLGPHSIRFDGLMGALSRPLEILER